MAGYPGFLMIILSFVRVPLYGLLTQAIESNNYFLATWYTFILANPYPLLPYLAYGFFGALIGMMIFNNRKDLFKKVIAPLGIFFVLFGLAGMMNFPKTISKPDYFWYFKTNFELGLFLLLLIFTILILNPGLNFLNKLPISNGLAESVSPSICWKHLYRKLLELFYILSFPIGIKP